VVRAWVVTRDGRRKVGRAVRPEQTEGTSVQALQEMEATAEGPVGGSTEGDREREGQPCDPRPVRR